MSNKSKPEESQTAQHWTLPVMESADAEARSKGKGFNPNKTVAWTSFAIGAVTKKVAQERGLQNNESETDE